MNEGAKSKVRIASLPGLEFEGSVSQVADEPRTERGVVSYPVRIKVDLPEGLSGHPPLQNVGVERQHAHRCTLPLVLPDPG